jgi:hypothetical protein
MDDSPKVTYANYLDGMQNARKTLVWVIRKYQLRGSRLDGIKFLKGESKAVEF